MNRIGDNEEKHRAFAHLVEAIEPLLVGQDSAVALAALADTAAFRIAQHPPIERPGLIEMHVALLHKLTTLHASSVANDNADCGEHHHGL